ncbi:Uncharacterized protein BM_BM14214, partial [Brugia malayi]
MKCYNVDSIQEICPKWKLLNESTTEGRCYKTETAILHIPDDAYQRIQNIPGKDYKIKHV